MSSIEEAYHWALGPEPFAGIGYVRARERWAQTHPELPPMEGEPNSDWFVAQYQARQIVDAFSWLQC